MQKNLENKNKEVINKVKCKNWLKEKIIKIWKKCCFLVKKSNHICIIKSIGRIDMSKSRPK